PRRSSYLASMLHFLHSLHVLITFFAFIFLFISISSSHFTNKPPSFEMQYHLGVQCLPIPPSSVSQSLDSLELSFLCQSSITKHGLRFPRYTNFLFSMLLILSGDINLNPGPVFTSTSLN